MATKDTFEAIMKSIYNEVVVRDCYIIKPWGSDFFDNIIDIGANVGCFVMYAHMRHPQANIFAYEPCESTYKYLVQECQFMDNITFINKALGDGSALFLHDTGWSGCNQFFKPEEKETSDCSIESISLSKMFKDHDISIDSKYYIKIDCEGGERFLLEDNDAVEIIRKSCGFGVEVHFPPRGKNPTGPNVERFNTFPTWDTYNAWVYDNFDETHNIIYHMSSGRRGAGVYVLQRR